MLLSVHWNKNDNVVETILHNYLKQKDAEKFIVKVIRLLFYRSHFTSGIMGLFLCKRVIYLSRIMTSGHYSLGVIILLYTGRKVTIGCFPNEAFWLHETLFNMLVIKKKGKYNNKL